MTECKLTALCLQYLTFECFELDIEPEPLRSFACQGYFVLQDYAIANWSYHLRAMVKDAEEMLGSLNEAPAALLELDKALQDFAVRYEDDIADNDHVEDKSCEAFNGCEFYPVLKRVMGHAIRHKEKVRFPFAHQIQCFSNSKMSSHVSCLWFGMSLLTLNFEMIGARSSERCESTQPGYSDEAKQKTPRRSCCF